MIQFSLYRLHVLPNRQLRFAFDDKTRPEILREILEALPTAERKYGGVWHVGNFKEVDRNGWYLRLGRTRFGTRQVFIDGTFQDIEDESSPYTHVFVDIPSELLAIAHRSELGTPNRLARNFVNLLSVSDRFAELNASLDFDAIIDPSDFVSQIQNAVSVSRFWFAFSRPNAINIEQDILKPAQELIETANGDTGEFVIKGEEISQDKLPEIIRDVAHMGSRAGATIRRRRENRSLRISMGEQRLTTSVESLTDETEVSGALQRIRDINNSVRTAEVSQNETT